jgi:cytochrome c oxidase subunit 2
MPAPVRRTTITSIAALVVALAFAGVALAGYGNGGVTPESSDSPNASGITDSYYLISGFTFFIFLLVEGLLIAFIVRFRRRRRPREAEGPQIHGAFRLEVLWTIFPVVVLAIIAGYVFYKLPGIKDVPEASAAADQVDITVEGHQFYWLFKYPNGAISVNTMVAPVGKTVKLTVISPDKDVNHSWWIPRLGGKIDAIPGYVNHTWFRVSKTGTYTGQCAEYCGTQHANMEATVRVVPQADYRRETSRLLAQLNASSPQLGKQIFQGVCEKCHRLSGPMLIGPTLGGNPILADRNALGDIVHNGRGLMPPVGDGWNDETLSALVAYTKTLTTTLGGGGAGGGQG